VIPAYVFGPQKALAYFREWDSQVRRPGMTQQGDQSRAIELTDIPATDSQSYVAIIHNTLNWDRATRPRHATWSVRIAHWAIGGVLTGLTLLAAGRQKRSAPAELVFFGSLIVMMVVLSPICHLHYFSLVLPLVLATVASVWEDKGNSRLHLGWWLLLAAFLLANTVPQLPDFYLTRDFGLAAYGALGLWLLNLLRLRAGLGRIASRHARRAAASAIAA
jgi:hypothetical protein